MNNSTTRRPMVGDKVRIVPYSHLLLSHHHLIGEVGTIVSDDFSVKPYRVLYEGLSNPLWLGENDVELVQEAPTASKPDLRLKPGDKVRVKPRDWYETHSVVKCKDSHVRIQQYGFNSSMAQLCGTIVTISKVLDIEPASYRIIEDGGAWIWSDDMFERNKPQGASPALRGKNKPVFKDNLPLIKTTRLLTNIKLD